MAFGTMMEWNETFDLDQYKAVIERSGGHDQPPAGCLSRIVGGDRVGSLGDRGLGIERDARRFAEELGPVVAEPELRPPDSVVFFETTFYRARWAPTASGSGRPQAVVGQWSHAHAPAPEQLRQRG